MRAALHNKKKRPDGGLIAAFAVQAHFLWIVPAGAAAATETPTDPAAIEALAFDYRLGRGRAADPNAAWSLFQKAAEAGLPNSQAIVAAGFLDGKRVPRDERKALHWFRAAADQGLPRAQMMLGWMYLSGTGVDPDAAQALKWLTASARQGNARALGYLGEMYALGHGVERDEEYTTRLMRRSAELGDPRATRATGWYLVFGPKERRDGKVGFHFLEKAAAAKDAEAAAMLGQAFLRGQSTPRDYPRAAQWFTRASEGDDPLATLWLSEIYFKGLGVAADQQKARQLLEQGLQKATASTKNDFAWALAVIGDDALRNGRLAVDVMKSVLVGADARNPIYLDTAAAAHAAAGDFDSAVAAEQAALGQLTAQHPAEMRQRFQNRLNAYRAQQDFREPVE